MNRAELNELIGFVLMGLECFYSKYQPERCEEPARIAQGGGPLISGGRDYH